MKRFRFYSRITAAILLMVTISMFNAFANPSNIAISRCDDVNRVVTISGTITTNRQNDDVILTVLNKDVSEDTFENTLPENVNTVLSYFAQKPLEADGTFTFTFKIKGETGDYEVLIDSKALNGTYSTSLSFTNTLWDELKTVKDDDTDGALDRFRTFVEAEFTSLGVDAHEYDQLGEDAKNAVNTAIKAFDSDYTQENFASEWNENVIWTFIDENRNNLSAVAEMVEKKHTAGNERFVTNWMPFYLENFSAKAQEALYTKVLADPECDTLDEFVAGMNDVLAITYVCTTEYWKDLYIMIEDESNVLGFNSSTLAVFDTLADKDTVVSNLYTQGKSKTTSVEIITLFDTLVAEQKTAEDNAANINNTNTGGGGGNWVVGKPDETSNDNVDKTPTENNNSVINTERFNDLASVEWAQTAINYLADKGILNGKGGGAFVPNDRMTREELVQMLDNAFGWSKGGSNSLFTDVDTDEWYYGAVAAASQKGIINGYEDGRFGIGDFVTREDTAVILLRAAGIDKFTGSAEPEFTDNADIAEYAKDAVGLLSSSKIINGMGDGRFSPKGYLTRAEAAKMFYGLLQYIKQ